MDFKRPSKELIEELKKYDIFVYVTTNGTLITQEVAERLVDDDHGAKLRDLQCQRDSRVQRQSRQPSDFGS